MSGKNKIKELKIWNGRGFTGRKDHLYIAAHSRVDAARLYCAGYNQIYRIQDEPNKSDIDRASREIKEYFCEGCWGNSMIDIEVERGLWYKEDDSKKEKPVKIV